MNKKIITFEANEQSLVKTGGISNYSSNKVSYIEAQFELGENWQGFDSVRAIWYNKAQTIVTVLADGNCTVPYEVLTDKGQVKVNLVGSISENDVLTDRLTSYPVVAFIVDAEAKVNGSNEQPITPSQFEQFVEAVKADAESASASAQSASESATSAHDDKVEIEQAIAEVIQQIEDFEQVQVVVNTLPPSSPATSDFTDGVLTLGIPQGAKGDTGNGIASCVLNPDYTLTINFTDGTSYITTSIRGVQGVKGDTGNGISSITKTGSETVDGRVVDTYTTTFTDGETTEFKVTNGKDGEVTMSQLSALLPTDTASGAIASFPDGQSVIPVKSLEVELEPIQDLNGYDHPWVGGAGKNKLSSIDATFTSNGVTWTLNDDGSVRLSGTATANSVYDLGRNIVELDAGAYFVNESANGYTVTVFSVVGGTASVLKTGGGNFALTEKTSVFVRVVVPNGTTVNTTLYPQIEVGSSPTSYEPYSNICPIDGHTEVNTQRTGKNMWGGLKMAEDIHEAVPNSVLDTSAKTVSYEASAVSGKTVYSDFLPNTQYTIILRGDNTSSIKTPNLSVRYTDGTNTQLPNFANGVVVFVTDSAKSVRDIRGVLATSTTTLYCEDCGVFEGVLTADDFEPYQGTTYTTDLGQTVYGGILDVVSGVLTVDRVMVDLGTLTWAKYNTQFYANIPNAKVPSCGVVANAICSNYPMAAMNALVDKTIAINDGQSRVNVIDLSYTDATAFTTAMNGVQLCYELATPQTYQLDPQTIDLLLGQNNLWTDCGSVEVTYKADIERWVNKKINALI